MRSEDPCNYGGADAARRMHAIATSLFGRRHGGPVRPEQGAVVEGPSTVQNTQSGDARLTLEQRRQALNAAGYDGHSEMLRNETRGNTIVENMPHAYLDDRGHSAFSSISQTTSFVLRHGLAPENRAGHNDLDLRTYDPETGWVNARELLARRRASIPMKGCPPLRREDGPRTRRTEITAYSSRR